MVRLREHEADADFINAARDLRRVAAQMDTQRFKHIRRTALRTHGAIAVLGHHRARARRDESRRRRNVEGGDAVPGRITAGAAGVNQVFALRRDARARAREAGDFLDGFAARPQRAQQRRDLQRRRRATHDVAHHGFGFGFAQGCARRYLRQATPHVRYGVRFFHDLIAVSSRRTS